MTGTLLSSAATEPLLYLSHTIENVIISGSSKSDVAVIIISHIR
jgi:hypothetical protein